MSMRRWSDSEFRNPAGQTTSNRKVTGSGDCGPARSSASLSEVWRRSIVFRMVSNGKTLPEL